MKDRSEEVGVGEEPDEQRADETADEVDTHHVEGVVVAEVGLELHGVAARRAGDEPDEDRRGTRDEAVRA